MSRSRALAALRIGVAVVILAAVVWAFGRNWTAVADQLARVGAGPLALALLLALVGPTLAMLGWRVLLADLGSPLPVASAAGVFFVGQLGKYLPGSVWTVLAQAEMGARLAVPRRRSAVVGLLGIGLSVLSGILVGLASVPLLWRSGAAGTLGWTVLAVPLLVLACWPRLLNALVAWGLRLLRREPLEHALSARAVMLTMCWFVGSWLAFGAQTWVLAMAVEPGELSGRGAGALVLAAVSGYALAGTVGMLAVVSPAGLGVREGLLVLLLDSATGRPAALAVVLLSRFTITVGDVVVAGLGWTYARRHGLLSAHPGAGPTAYREE
ncbi:MAG TPA: lysylphosphatidylglycerol synthase domain-containing protein [Dermatophilaceae bacterium]|nr:lysylphosphatidylglycerol synthase domain-containing protein [Dermatophilaceae bacterium]